jgi:poly-gamma-glutamate synthesis protein (capsule biosynthesis protein)
MVERPEKKFIEFAHALIDRGVDIVHGHSAHIFQGVEIYKKKLILYDTGDFIDDYYVDPVLRNDRSFLFIVQCAKQKICNLRLIPVIIDNFQVNRAKDADALPAMKRMEMLSKERGTQLEFVDGELVLQVI